MSREHHTEQMEAVRRDFQELWRTKLLQAALDTGAMTDRALFQYQHIAWLAFVERLNIRQPLNS